MLDKNNLRHFKILGIDPGSSNMGLACIEVGINKEILNTEALTIEAKKTDYYYLDISKIFTDRKARLLSMKSTLYEYLEYYNPGLVICESPFFNRFTPNAYPILLEVCHLIEETVLDYNSLLKLETVDPPTAKKAVYAKGNAKKDEMALAISKMKKTLHLNTLDLDEHSIDAIAMAYFAYRRWILGDFNGK